MTSYAEAIAQTDSMTAEEQAEFKSILGDQWPDFVADVMVSVDCHRKIVNAERDAVAHIPATPDMVRALANMALHSVMKGDSEDAMQKLGRAEALLDRMIAAEAH